MFQDYRQRHHIAATQQLIERLPQCLAHEPGRRFDGVAWGDPAETSSPAGRRLYRPDFSVYGARERHSFLVPAEQLAADATGEGAQRTWTVALAAVVASLGATP